MKIFALLLILGVITNSTSFAGGPRKQRQMEEKDQKMEEENDNNGMDEEYIVHSGDRKNPEIEVEKEEFKFIEGFDPNSVYKEEIERANQIYTRLIELTGTYVQGLARFPVQELYSQIYDGQDHRGNVISCWYAVNEHSKYNEDIFFMRFYTDFIGTDQERNIFFLNGRVLENPETVMGFRKRRIPSSNYVLYPKNLIALLCLLTAPSNSDLNQLKKLDLDFVSASGAKLLKKADWRNLEVLRINVRSRDNSRDICSKEILVPLTKIQIKREAKISYSVHYDTPTNMLPGTLVPHDRIELDHWKIIRHIHDGDSNFLLQTLFQKFERKPIEKMQSSVVSVARLGPKFNQYYDQVERRYLIE